MIARPAERDASAAFRSEAAGMPAVASAMITLFLGPSTILLLSFGTFMAVLHADFGWPIAAISLGASIISVTIMLVSPLQGVLVDRFGVRVPVMVSLPLWGAALMLMSLLPADIRFFYGACVLLPMAALGIWPLTHLKLATTWFDRHVGLAIGAINLAVGLGAAVLPVALSASFVRFGLSGTYLLLGVIVLVVIWPIAAIYYRPGPRGIADPAAGLQIGLTFGEAVRTRAFALMIADFFILGLINTSLLIHQVPILLDAGLSSGSAIYVQSAIGIGTIFGRIGTGWLLDRVAVQKVGFAMFAIASAACLLLASHFAGPLAMVAAATFGIVIGAEFDVLGVLIRRYHGIFAFGRLFGLVFSAFQLGGAIGAGVMGYGRVALGSYAPMLILLALLCALGGLLFPFYGAYRFAPARRSGGRPYSAITRGQHE